jgi:hypothetical protein
MLACLRATTTRSGLRMTARLNDRTYATKIKVSDQEMKSLNLGRQDTCPQWNYAYHNGVEPIPKPPSGITATAYDCDPDLLARLHRLVGNAPFTVHVAKRFPLEQAADAQRMLDTHYLAKLSLKV